MDVHKLRVCYFYNRFVSSLSRRLKLTSRRRLFVLTLFLLMFPLVNIWTLSYKKASIKEVEARVSNPRFVQELLRRADGSFTVLLALTDSSFVDMAINFYLTSLKPHGIENYLFVGISDRTCESLRRRGLACYPYTEDPDAEVESSFNSDAFLRKTNLRTEMILDALLAGLTVLQTDVDVVFRENPFPELMASDSDISVLWDSSSINAGFLLIHPNKRTVWIYDRVRKQTRNRGLNDQIALHQTVKHCSRDDSCQATILDRNRFQNGLLYFEEGHRRFAGDNPCADCVVIHNNYIVSKNAKVYRFKEHHMWFVDADGYYTSAVNNYLTYDTPETPSVAEQGKALANALAFGEILNRVVILPKFRCPSESGLCPMNSLFRISEFDKYFLNRYRESTFLSHPLVPSEVTNSVKRASLGNTNSISSHDIQQYFGAEKSRVLHLPITPDVDVYFSDPTKRVMFRDRLRSALVQCDYRQFCKQEMT